MIGRTGIGRLPRSKSTPNDIGANLAASKVMALVPRDQLLKSSRLKHLVQTPNMAGDAGLHRRRHPQAPVDPAEVVVHEMQRARSCIPIVC